VYSDYYIPGGISPYPRDFIIDGKGLVRYANIEYDINKMIAVLRSLKPGIDLDAPTISPNPPVDNDPEDRNERTRLLHNYPNPFSEETTITFHIPRRQFVTLSIYNIQGKLVKRFKSDYTDAGEHTVVWNATNFRESPVASGVYIYELATPTRILRKKLIVLQ
jgi:hypothetical protein